MNQNDHKGPVVVIYVHGLYGSVLVNNKTGRVEYNLPTSLLRSAIFHGNRGHNVALPTTWSKSSTDNNNTVPVQDKDNLIPTVPLRYIHSGLLDCLESLRDSGSIELHTPVWDWRRAFEETEPKLANDIDAILDRHPRRRAVLITHSTGALVSWPSLNRRPGDFSAWVNIGGALGGSNALVKELRNGWGAPGAEFLRLFSAMTMCTFPSHFGFFVSHNDGERFGGPTGKETDFFVVDKETGDNVFLTSKDIDLHNYEDWKKFRLGMYGWKGKDRITDEDISHLRHSLEAARRFRSKHYAIDGVSPDSDAYLLHDRSEYSHLRIINYGSDKSQTHLAYEVDIASKTVDLTKSGLTAPGDSTILSAYWRYIPGNLKTETILSEKDSLHIPMLGDEGLLDLIGDLVGVPQNGTTRMQKESQYFPASWAVIFVVLSTIAMGVAMQKNWL